ncbi:MAG: translational GTPase TypA [Candidatus Woesebacteria bacterium]|jgi:GTP-binding protein
MQIRNIAIIAHVDHGKTTLIDGMLKQTDTFRINQAEMSQHAILDQNDLEKEKGITILAKNTAVFYKDYKINIIDTPGHADFSGEVERVINMADGALLIVDAAEGPLPQTKFVLQKAIEQNLKIIVIINKIDRKDAQPEQALKKTEELFLNLADNDQQLIFPVLYAAGRAGKIWHKLPTNIEEAADLSPLFEEIIKTIPESQADANKPFKMLVSNLDFDDYKGTYAIGKVSQGIIKTGQNIVLMDENKILSQQKIQHIFTSRGLSREEIETCQSGDIIAITGIKDIRIGQTIVDPIDPTGYPRIQIGEATIKIQISANSSPLAGREGDFVTARQLKDRLKKEQKTNIGLKIESQQNGKGFMVAGRGELHLAILVENMRREGYEMEVAKPQVILKEINGQVSEPIEELTIEIDQNFVGIITEELGKRKGELIESFTNDKAISRMVYRIASKNLLGFRSKILTKTRGNGLFSSHFLEYQAIGPKAKKLRNGALVASHSGNATSYALRTAQNRGLTFIPAGSEVYQGMIIGLNKQSEDIEINVTKAKKLTNFRSNADISVPLEPPMILSLEQSLDFIEDDELLEVTPKNLRLRKKFLDKGDRVKQAKKMALS